MARTIVVPLDGSAEAERALDAARWLADGFGAGMLLFTAGFALDTGEEEQYLHHLVGTHALPRAAVEVAVGRSAGPAIARAVRGADDGLLCMATHGRTGLRAMVLGSVADEAVRELNDPAVLVGPSYESGPQERELLVCWDGSDVSALIAPDAARWARDVDLSLRVVAVRTRSQEAVLVDAAGEPLEAATGLLAALAESGKPVEVEELVDHDPATAIARLAATRRVALVALCTRGRGGLASSSFGRVAANVVSRSPCPVMIRRP